MKRLWQRRHKDKTTVHLDKRSLYALGALLFLSQLPHLLHLPLSVSIIGVGIVVIKLWAHHRPSVIFNTLLSPIVMTITAFAGAMLVRMHYGYFMGRDPCVAFLFILVSAKFAEVRKPSDSTLLLCLASFLLLTQYFYSQSILSALITLPAVLALGNALAVIRDSDNAPSTRNNVRMVGKLLIQGAPLAIVLFFVFPRMPGPLWSLPEDAAAKTGLSDSMSPGTIGSLSLSDEVAFRVEFNGPPPPVNQRYWRGPVMDNFDGRRWTVSENTARVSVPNYTDHNDIHYTVMMQSTNQQWLFALDHPTSLPMSDSVDADNSRILATLTPDLQLKTAKPVTHVMRYKQTSSLSDAFKSPVQPTTDLTRLVGTNPKAMTFAKQLRSKTNSPRHYAQSVLAFFNQEQFHYTLQPSLLGHSPVDEFLFSTRSGFCEHYASAFVVLLRAAGIPARVVTGYLGGEMNGNYMIVRQSDAHAWAEAFINGQWVRYDPTGAVAPARVDNNMAAALGDGEPVPLMARQGNAWLKQFKLSIDELNHDWQRLVVNFNNDSQHRIWEKLGLPRLKLWQIMVVVLIITAIWCIAILGLPFSVATGMREDDKLWNRYIKTLARLGVQRLPSETPNQLIDRATVLLANNVNVRALGDDLVRLRFQATDTATHAQLVQKIKHALNKLHIHSLLHRQAASRDV